MGKNVLKVMGCLFVLFLFPHGLLASPGVKILSSTNQGQTVIKVSLDQIKAFPSTFTAIDPNFKKDGLTRFTGTNIKKLLSSLDISFKEGVTIVGMDQYIGYIPHGILAKNQAFIAWELNEKPIGIMKGGPLKMIYSRGAKVHGSCYVWYVDAIIAGEPDANSFFELSFRGKTTKIRARDFLSDSEILDEKLFSIPAGCRNGMKPKTCERIIKAINLNRLIELTFGTNAHQVTLIPSAGSSVLLKKQALSFPIYITLSCDGKPIHPALGGPFSVIFPIEHHRTLAGLVPESGALFFLDKIMVE